MHIVYVNMQVCFTKLYYNKDFSIIYFRNTLTVEYIPPKGDNEND